jgi:hypothetical protein
MNINNYIIIINILQIMPVPIRIYSKCSTHTKDDLQKRTQDPRDISPITGKQSETYFKCTKCKLDPPQCWSRFYQCSKCGCVGILCSSEEPFFKSKGFKITI